MMLPTWLEIEQSENTACAMYRNLRGLSGSWGEMIAEAQTVMSYYQDYKENDLPLLYDQGNALQLIAAARILDSASKPPSSLPREERAYAGLAAAVAYSMYGNFASSRATVKQVLFELPVVSPEEATILATISPGYLPMMLDHGANSPIHRTYLELLNKFYFTGAEEDFRATVNAYEQCTASAATSFGRSLFLSARLALGHCGILAIARVLRDSNMRIPVRFVQSLLAAEHRVFLPPQYLALVKFGFTGRSDNALIALPPSTGKTLLGELALASALGDRPGVVCYLAPYVALGDQVVETLRSHFPKSVRVHRLVGGFESGQEQLKPNERMECIVATPERLDALLRNNPQIYNHLRCVVCDEAHMIESGSRGARLEGIFTRLRLLRRQGAISARLVLISAVLSDYGALCNWMDIPSDAVIKIDWRAAARRLAFWKQSGSLTWLLADDPIRRPSATGTSPYGERVIPWPNRLYATDKIGAVRSQAESAYGNVAYLVESITAQYPGAILCVCSTKAGARQLAKQIALRYNDIAVLPSGIAKAVELVDKKYPFLAMLRFCLVRGVTYHNSAIPRDLSRIIIASIKDGELKAVAATTTLAEGVDLPFRFTIIADWMLWQTGKQSPMSTLLFKNIAGRCGRAGVYSEGDTIIFDNPLGDLRYTHASSRDIIQEKLFILDEPAPVASVIDGVIAAGTAESESVGAVLASQLLAAIPENPKNDDLATDFASNTYASFLSPARGRGLQLFQTIRSALLDKSRGALAVAASPMSLTPFGKAANSSGFSPESARRIADALRESIAAQDLISVCDYLLRSLSDLPEQTFGRFRDVFIKPKSHFPVKPADIKGVLERWLDGTPHLENFAALPAVKKAHRQMSFEDWIKGTAEMSTWDESYDMFTEFITLVLEGYLPWLLRACEAICPYAQGWCESIPWGDWATQLEALAAQDTSAGDNALN